MISAERKGLTVSVSRDSFLLRSFVCRSLQAAVTLETKLIADTNFASWWATASDDPQPSAAHPHERPFTDTPTPAVLRTKSHRRISVTTADALLIISDGERTRRKACSNNTVARNLSTRYSNDPELAERWLYAERRDTGGRSQSRT